MVLTMKPNLTHSNLTVQAPPWDVRLDDPTANNGDNFHMYEFKIRKCARVCSHDWTECPFAHAGEKARRRDPRKVHYSGATCPNFRKGTCAKGDKCEYSHGVFETWLHPSRYRTQPCKDGTNCLRLVCFFAHTPEQIRVLPNSLSRLGLESDSAQPESPPLSPLCELPAWGNGLWPSQLGFDSAFTRFESPPMSPVCELSVSMRNMSISLSSPCWEMGYLSTRPSFFTLPSTSKAVTRPESVFDLWDEPVEEEPLMERVESGRDLRARMYAKLSRDNSVDRVDPGFVGHDMSWY